MNKEAAIEFLHDRYDGTESSLEEMLAALKRADYSQIETIKLLVSVLGFTLQSADRAVLESQAWREERSATIELRTNFDKTIESES